MEETVTITFKMNKRTANLFKKSSLERVINTSMRMVERSKHEDASINYEDWQEWKPICTTIWYAIHSAIMANGYGMKPNQDAIELHKGDI